MSKAPDVAFEYALVPVFANYIYDSNVVDFKRVGEAGNESRL